MDKPHEILPSNCLNCGTTVNDVYCRHCSQRVRDNTDRSLGQLLGEFLANVFFIDNRFLISVWYLFRYPGRMTVEFLDGKRKKFISPVTLFLFVNLLYFFLTTLTDYSLSLGDQLNSQVYSGEWMRDMVRTKLRAEGLSNSLQYAPIYQKASETVSKSVMIINVPLIALLIYLLAFRKRRYYYDSLLFSFHFFTLFLVIMTAAGWLDELIILIAGHEVSEASDALFYLFLNGIPILYGILSIKRFLNLRWYWAIPAGIGVATSVVLANLVYRLIIFALTLWFT